MKSCKNCDKSIFDKRWGEYKCKEYHITVRELDIAEVCEFYDERKKDGTKTS